MTVKVAYRAGLEHQMMKVPGELQYFLGKADGLSRAYGWGAANKQVIEMTDADAKVMEEHQQNGGLRNDYPRFDFLTGDQIPGMADPEFLIGEKAITEHAKEFGERYKAYAEAAAALVAVPSVEIFQGAGKAPAPAQS